MEGGKYIGHMPEHGRYGEHGGRYIPETLMNAVIELEKEYLHYSKDKDFCEELQRLFNKGGVPIVTIGGQTIRGFEEGEWNSYLDAAGYPKASVLPSAWRNPAPTPLVEDAPVVSTGDDAGAAPELTGTGADVPAAPPASIEPEITPTNPTGLRF